MKKRIMRITSALISVAMSAVIFTGCQTEADRVSYNLSLEADNFNDVRQITVINCLQGDVLFQMTGKMSIEADTMDNQLEIIVEDENGKYKKHFIGLSDNVTYVSNKCEYCGTRFDIKVAPVRKKIETEQLCHVCTVNEMRALFGLRPLVSMGISTEEATSAIQRLSQALAKNT